MTYDHYWWARMVIAVLTLAGAILTVGYFATAHRQVSICTAILVVFWALVPPLWFFGEYYAIERGFITDLPGANGADAKAKFLESIKSYADYASKIWAAVLAAVLFLIDKG